MKTIINAFCCYVFTLTACLAAGNMSVETLGVIKLPTHGGDATYGAGVVGAYKFNQYVAAWGRTLAYESPDNWGGSAIDEASAGVEATLLRSANGGLTLAAIGGVHRSFDEKDWGIGVGGKATIKLWRDLYGFGQAEYRAWDKQESDILLTFGLGLKF